MTEFNDQWERKGTAEVLGLEQDGYVDLSQRDAHNARVEAGVKQDGPKDACMLGQGNFHVGDPNWKP